MCPQADDKNDIPSGPSATRTKWAWPAKMPLLKKGVIHLWRLDTLSMGERWREYRDMLSERETKRANRYHFKADRVAFILRRSVLRILAGHYLGIDPQVLEFTKGLYGKPKIIARLNKDGLQFNISVSNAIILLGFAIGRNIGVDVERVRPIDDIDSIAKHFFSPSEKALLLSQPPNEKLHSFYRIWTLKEALLKALGIGLTQGAGLFGIRLKANDGVEIIDNQLDILNSEQWSLKTIECDGNYYAATAFDAANDIDLQYFRFHSIQA